MTWMLFAKRWGKRTSDPVIIEEIAEERILAHSIVSEM